ncbi:ATP-dependent Clp protease proteolytic subunit [Streptomyces candidus]|uniref:ATP-dependent Clp protease proteolytic subunit n=1 Tax=Streptomyces candidus TaxID=67283 RepID=A0A7X0HHP0_9ACTN|nr:ATP-dependent Clp protease proteolytic subunit [Streptomyces candidus]MBB6437780.1 ATP-dependent Clp protease protease subunit [Streptomyces candidus]GHH50228.1 putative ATP-dependent Clp protease proteolytic subunit-like protein [Streptomyces candidus]
MIQPYARHVLPQFHERTSTGTRTLDPYSKMLGERIVFLGTPVDDTAANDIAAQFMYLEHDAPDRDISLYINSPGGSYTAMAAIYDTLQFVTCDVETICLGQALDAAAVLLACGTAGKRLALPGARIALSQPALDEPAQGQPSDLEIHARELVRLRSMTARMLARHTGRSAEQVEADFDRTKVLDAGEALGYGLVDRIVANRRGALPSSAR